MTLERIPDGVAGVRVTLDKMRTLVEASKRRPLVRLAAVELVKGIPQWGSDGRKTYRDQAERLHQFVRDRVQYVRDTRGVEVLHTPEWLLKQRAGDCDDKSVLLASLLEAIGFQTRFVAVGPAPGIFAHVYVEVRIGNEWVPAETTEPVPLGWEPPNVAARMYG